MTLYDEVNNNKDPGTASLPVLLGYRFGDTEKGNSVWRRAGHKARIGWEPGVEEMVEWIYAQTKAAVYISFMPMIPNGSEIHVPYYDNLPDDQRPDFRADTLYAACEKAVRQVYKDFVATEE